MKPTVLLFDIDGTIITTGGAARLALETAVADLYALPTFAAEFPFGGMTDRGIMRGALTQLGQATDDTAIDAAVAHYISRLDGVLADAPRYIVHPGIREVILRAQGYENIALGLGTGNVEAGARIKLARVDLNAPFAFGGFGCDDEDRAALILAGARRGVAQLNTTLDACRVVIIGDTTRDVDAAHANGFECVAVCTGGVSREVLEGAGADWCFETLADPGAEEAILYGRAA